LPPELIVSLSKPPDADTSVVPAAPRERAASARSHVFCVARSVVSRPSSAWADACSPWW
jgi:hypothetical protein